MALYSMYLRKSRADLESEAHGEGETLKRHENILRSLATRMKIHIKEEDIYREVVTAETIAGRPVMQDLLSKVEQGLYSGVLVIEVERLARGDTMDQGLVAQTFKYSSTKIITPNKTYDPNNEYDEEYFEFGLFMSRREYKTINRRLQSGRISSVNEGKYVGNKPPYGYLRVKLENQKGFTLEAHPEQAPVVKMIYDLYLHGEGGQRLGSSLIVRKLNNLKIPSYTGDTWTPSSIRTILRNPVYNGKIKWNSRPEVKKMIDGQIVKERPRAKKEDWILVQGLHEAIIDDGTWNQVQELMSHNPPVPNPRKRPVTNPLAGIVTCGVCGRKMVRRPHGHRYPPTLICTHTACSNISTKLSVVEDRLLETLREYKIGWEKAKKEDKSPARIELKQTALDNIVKEIESTKNQINKLHDFLEQGIYTTEVFLERYQILNSRASELESSKLEVQAEIQSEKISKQNAENVIPKIDHLLNIYHVSDDAPLKNQLLKKIVRKVVFTKTVRGDIDNFDLEVFLF